MRTAIFEMVFRNSIARDIASLAGADDELRADAFERLRRLEARAVPLIIRSFADLAPSRTRAAPGDAPTQPSERRLVLVHSLLCLSKSSEAVVIPALIEALGDGDSRVRHYSGFALGFLGSSSVDALIAALRSSADVRVRTAAAWTLSLIGSEAAASRPTLTAALQDVHKDVFSDNYFAQRRQLERPVRKAERGSVNLCSSSNLETSQVVCTDAQVRRLWLEMQSHGKIEKAALVAYALVHLWYFSHGDRKADVARVRKQAPWYLLKVDISFADMLAAARREFWIARLSRHPVLRVVRKEIEDLIPQWLLSA